MNPLIPPIPPSGYNYTNTFGTNSRHGLSNPHFRDMFDDGTSDMADMSVDNTMTVVDTGDIKTPSYTEHLRELFKTNLWFNHRNNSYCYSLAVLEPPWEKLNFNSGGDQMSYYTHFRQRKKINLSMLARDSYSVWKAINEGNNFPLVNVNHLTIYVFLDNPGENYLELNGVQHLNLNFTADNFILYRTNSQNVYIPDRVGLNAIGANINSTLYLNVSHLKQLHLDCLNPDERQLKVRTIDYGREDENASMKLNSLGTNFSIGNMSQAEFVYSNADSLRNVHVFEQIAQNSHQHRDKKIKLMAKQLNIPTDIMTLTTQFLGSHEINSKNLMDKTTQSTRARMKRKEYLEQIRKIKKASKKASKKAEGFKKRKPKKTLKKRKSRK